MKRPPVVPATVKGLGLVSLLNDFASEMVYPLLPQLVTRNLGAGAIALGALDGAADLTSAILRWFSGRLADRPRWTKPLIVLGYSAATVVRPVIALTTSAWQVIGIRVLDRVGKGLRTPARDALVAQITPEAQRGRAFGFHRAADHFGAVAGSLAAWLLLSRAAGVRDVILLSVVPGVVAVLALVIVLGTAGRQGHRRTDEPADGRAGGQAVRQADGRAGGQAGSGTDATGWRFWGPALALTLLTVGRLPETLLLLRLQDLGVAAAAVPLAWAGLHLVRSVGSYPGGWLSDRIGARTTLGLGGIGFAVVALLLASSIAVGPAVAGFVALGLVTALVEPGEKATVAKLAPVRTGRGFGAYQAVSGMTALPAGIALGWVYDNRGGSAALLTSAALVLVGVAAWLGVTRRET